MERNSINEVNKVCKAVLKLRDRDITEVEKMYKEQEGYCHPLKNATAKKHNDIGRHNKKVVYALKALRDAISEKDEEPDITERVEKIYFELRCEKERELTAEEKELIKIGYHAALLDTSYDMAIGSKGVFRKV